MPFGIGCQTAAIWQRLPGSDRSCVTYRYAVCVCACVRAYVRACVRECVRACVFVVTSHNGLLGFFQSGELTRTE